MVTALAWLPGSARFLSGGFDKRVCFWAVHAPEPEAVLQGERVTDLAVSRDGSKVRRTARRAGLCSRGPGCCVCCCDRAA